MAVPRDKKLNGAIDAWCAEQRASLEEVCDAIESPIERLLLVALAGYPLVVAQFEDVDPRCECCVPLGGPYGEFHLQHPITIGKKTYRPDFVLFGRDKLDVRLAIECDGHDFHEKTKEQVANDKRRERDLIGAGWIVLRFAGSEIWKDAKACAGAVLNAYVSEYNRRSLLVKESSK